MKALIHDTRVVQVISDDDAFPIAPSLEWVDAEKGVTTEYIYQTGELIPPPAEPLNDLAARKRREVESARKASEAQGITRNGIRYAGGPNNRQALAEALDLVAKTGQTAFACWKDSDGLFHSEHSAADVHQALLDIATRRGQLIAREGEINTQINSALAAEDRQALQAIEW